LRADATRASAAGGERGHSIARSLSLDGIMRVLLDVGLVGREDRQVCSTAGDRALN
jgi:hypothetical protein